MKTNVVLVSQSRELFGVIIRQETKESFLNLSDLQKSYGVARELHGWSDKRVSDILSSESNAERVFYILQKQGFINTTFSAFMELVQKDGLTKVLKSLGCYKTTGRGENKTTSCNQYVWVLVALEMNPMIYGEVVYWLGDKLILNRIEAGNMYRGLSKAVSKFPDVDYAKLGTVLNHVIFKKHETGIRNMATEAELKDLENLERNLAFAIDRKFIKSFPELLDHLRDEWRLRHTPKLDF